MRTGRGVAMLITLMTMTVLIAGVAIIARVRATSHLISLHAANTVRVQDLLHTSDGPILAWLEEQASHAVVDPAMEIPMLPVLDDRMLLSEQPVRVRITAWDQYGMIPLNAHDLGLDVGTEDVAWKGARYPGLDLDGGHQSVFPSPESPEAVGGRIATHNPWPTRSGTTRSRSGAAININTASVELIETLFQKLNLGDPSSIIENRAGGEFSSFTLNGQDARQNSVRFLSISRVWSFRIDVWAGTIRRSCWCTYTNQGGHWRLVQRIIIEND